MRFRWRLRARFLLVRFPDFPPADVKLRLGKSLTKACTVRPFVGNALLDRFKHNLFKTFAVNSARRSQAAR